MKDGGGGVRGGMFPLSLIDSSSEGRGGTLINHKRGISSTFTRVLTPLLTSSCGLRSILVATETHADAVTASHSSNGGATADD